MTAQPLVLGEIAWACPACKAPLADSVITHQRDCWWIAEVRAAGMAEATRAHVAEQDAVHAGLSQLLRVLGMGDHARPQSSHEVMLDAINEVGRLRTRLAEIENAVTWNTSCTSCATVLDSAYRETCRREAAEAALARVRALDSAAILIGGERYVRADYVREALEGDSDE